MLSLKCCVNNPVAITNSVFIYFTDGGSFSSSCQGYRFKKGGVHSKRILFLGDQEGGAVLAGTSTITAHWQASTSTSPLPLSPHHPSVPSQCRARSIPHQRILNRPWYWFWVASHSVY